MTTGACLALAVLWAPQLAQLPSLWQYLQSVLAYVVPPVVALFVVGLFWRGANAHGAWVMMLVGTACGFGLFLSNVVFGLTHMHFLYCAPILLAIDIAVLVTGSRLSRSADKPDIDRIMFTMLALREDSLALAGVPPWRNYRYQSLLLLAATALIVLSVPLSKRQGLSGVRKGLHGTSW